MKVKDILLIGLNAIEATAIFIFAVLVLTIAICSSYRLGETQDALDDANAKIVAYENAIYRIWIDNPSYVEDVFDDTDEFITLHSATNGECDDIFQYKSPEDSVIQIHRRKVYEPDTLPKPAPKDYE